jgi:ketosteroid isomerase-like protein
VSGELELARGIYRAFAAGDMPAVLGVFAPEIHWTEAAGGPYGGVLIGPEAVLADVFMKIATEWDGFTVVPEEFVRDGATVVALGEYSGTCRATGKHFRAPFAHVWKFGEGKAVSFHQHTDTAAQLAAMQP